MAIAKSTDRAHGEPLAYPLAYFLTWTTYGTWLPGDDRGWIRRGKGFQLADVVVRLSAESRMTEPRCTLDSRERDVVERTITEHCQLRGWKLHAVRCRSNHVHVVVTSECLPETVRDQLKAWCTRKLKALQSERFPHSELRSKWWTERGSQRHIGDEESLEAVILYVMEAQDRKDRDHDRRS